MEVKGLWVVHLKDQLVVVVLDLNALIKENDKKIEFLEKRIPITTNREQIVD